MLGLYDRNTARASKECLWELAKVGFVTDGLFGGFAKASWIYFSGCP